MCYTAIVNSKEVLGYMLKGDLMSEYCYKNLAIQTLIQNLAAKYIFFR